MVQQLQRLGLGTILIVVFTAGKLCSGANILILCFPLYSHLTGRVNVGEVLQQQGHNVTVAVPQEMQDLAVDRGLNVLLYHGIKDLRAQTNETFTMIQQNFLDGHLYLSEIPILLHFAMEISEQILTGEHFYEDLQSTKPDLLILDGDPPAVNLAMVTCKLDIPFIFIGQSAEGPFARTPGLSTVVPNKLFDFTDDMSFLQRLANSIAAVVGHFHFPTLSVSRFCPERPGTTIHEIHAKASLWIEVHDGILDYNKPIMPNIKQVSNLLRARPLKAIPPKLRTFLDNAEYGVIIVSLGSLLPPLPMNKLQTMLEAFRETKYNYVIKDARVDMTSSSDPQFFFTRWMPQLELLCHNNTRLFITHCGANGQQEAIYAGLPMIGFPIYADQLYNAARMVRKGFGLRLDLRTFTSEELVDVIKQMATDPKYKARTKKASAIVRATRVLPVEEAAFWINHVLTFGDKHLRSLAQDVPLWKYLGLDILAFCLLVWHILLFVFIKIINFIVNWCRNKTAKSKSE